MTKKCICRKKLEKLLPAAYDKYTELIPALELMVQYREETLSQMNHVADHCRGSSYSGKGTRESGSGKGTTGGGQRQTTVREGT